MERKVWEICKGKYIVDFTFMCYLLALLFLLMWCINYLFRDVNKDIVTCNSTVVFFLRQCITQIRNLYWARNFLDSKSSLSAMYVCNWYNITMPVNVIIFKIYYSFFHKKKPILIMVCMKIKLRLIYTHVSTI
jgi:hypothetical protein